MKKISTLGIDLAKNSFQVCAMDQYNGMVINLQTNNNLFLYAYFPLN
ncbi:MAG: hypothetical protein KAQ98_02610 [Bacteriovoracaceae bacterium]|nr:hypothetical protein [Bacteriovoracaceae bacterium]